MSIAGKTWREVRALAVLYVALLLCLLLLALAWWPEARLILEKKADLYRVLAPTEALKKFFQDAASHVESAAYAAYIGIQHFFKAVSIVGIACAVLLGTGTIAKEKERGTFEFLASRPVSRTGILWPITWVLTLCLVLPIFATSLIIPWLSPISGQTLPLHGLLQGALHSSLFVELFLLLTLLMSVLLKTQVQVATTIGAIVIFQVGIFFVPGIRNTSIFKLTDYEIYQFMVPGNLDYMAFFWSTDIWLILANGLLFLVTWILFRRRDLG